jgi:hypothetical protein
MSRAAGSFLLEKVRVRAWTDARSPYFTPPGPSRWLGERSVPNVGVVGDASCQRIDEDGWHRPGVDVRTDHKEGDVLIPDPERRRITVPSDAPLALVGPFGRGSVAGHP